MGVELGECSLYVVRNKSASKLEIVFYRVFRNSGTSDGVYETRTAMEKHLADLNAKVKAMN